MSTDESTGTNGLLESLEIVDEEEGQEQKEEETTPINDHPDIAVSSRNDWCKLLFQDGYIKVLKQLALSGELLRSNIRAVCWKVFLGCLSEDQSQWVEESKKSRERYAQIKQKHMVDPHGDEKDVDLAINNPLSLNEESPWNQFFQDSEIKQTITQDIVRTHPDQRFFRESYVQTAMLDILFCYAKENPDMGYRQGMHELLAPILFVLHAESREDLENDDSIRPELKVVMDPKYIVADAYTIFNELMEGMQQFYVSGMLEADIQQAKEKQAAMKHDPRISVPFEGGDYLFYVCSTSSISRKLDKIQEVLLKRIDEQLFYRLQDLGIPSQTYGIRWIRLLFGREFFLPNVLQIWDALFVDGTSLALVDYLFVAMLIQIREPLLTGDYGACMQLLMHYPTMYEVNDLIQKALSLKNPERFQDSRLQWTTIPSVGHASPQLRTQEQAQSDTPKKSNRVKQEFTNRTKALAKQMHIPTRQIHLPTKLNINKSTDTTTKAATGNGREHPRSNEVEQEMVKNPKARPRASSDLDKVKEQLDNAEGKCLYCGRKMETILEELQGQVENLELSEETEAIIHLDIAALKQVRDLLLHKIPFSGEPSDYEALTSVTSAAEKKDQLIELFDETFDEKQDDIAPDDKLSSSIELVES